MGKDALSRIEYTLFLCLVFLMSAGHAVGVAFNFFHLSELCDDKNQALETAFALKYSFLPTITATSTKTDTRAVKPPGATLR